VTKSHRGLGPQPIGREENHEGSKNSKEDTKKIGRKKAQKSQKTKPSSLRLFAANLSLAEVVDRL
jgi:hypothetical protein